VKSNIFLTTLLTAAISLSATSIYALADGEVYPENFDAKLTFTSLNDFAIDGEKFAFADGNYIFVYENGKLAKTEGELSHAVKSIDFFDGELLFKDSTDEVYRYFDGEVEKYQGEYEFITTTSATVEDYYYYFNDNGLNVLNLATALSTSLGSEFNALKCYDNCVYAVKNNALYKIEGAEASELEFVYDDYSSANSILRAGFDQAFSNTQEVSFKKIAGGAYITEIDLSETDGDYFVAKDTKTANDGTVALLVASYGNASIVAFGGKSYITLSDNLAAVEFTPTSADKQFGNTNLLVGVYSTPFMRESTKVATLTVGDAVKILGAYKSDVLDAEYYLVEYGNEGAQGFIAKNFITPNDFSAEENGFESVGDEPVYDNEIKTVVIVLTIILLVFAVIIYVLYVALSNKTKHKASSDEENIEIIK